MIEEFVKQLQSKVSERDPFATVKVFKTPETLIKGEYLAVIESGKGEIETYIFNPKNKTWIICYQI